MLKGASKYLVEFIGTFFLVFTVGMTVINTAKPGDNSAGAMAPLAIGSVLMVMIFAGGHISGGHYNPAVTLAVFLRGKCPLIDVLVYWICQLAAAAAAAYLVLYVKHPAGREADGTLMIPALIVEAIFTFALCYVVLNVATAKGTSGNSFYGLAIGFTVVAGAYAVGPVSGGAFNPAVALGITLMKLKEMSNIWIYLVSELGAGALAAIVFKLVNPPDDK